MTLPPTPHRGPVFIIGSMGSGTTLLRLMLDSHDNIAIPHETGFMRAYNAMAFIPFKWTGRRWAYRLGWSHEELDEELRRFFDRIFMRYASQHGKSRWGEKTPLHTYHITDMARLFPDAVFVSIVRHPGATVASNMARFRQTATKAISHYLLYNKEIARQAAILEDRFVVMRYEELLLKTEPVMRELMEWLGEPWSDQLLEHHVVQGERKHFRVEGHSKADDPIDVARIDKWTRTMQPGHRRWTERWLTRIGEFYGYSMTDAGALGPLHDRGTLLFGGADLNARFGDFPDLDMETQMPVPKRERRYDPRKFTLEWKEEPEPIIPDPPRPEPFPASPARRAARTVVRRLPEPARRRLVTTYRGLRARRREVPS